MDQKIKRRSLLGGLGVAAAGLFALKAAPVVQDKIETLAAPAEPEGTGYRLTEHVKKYYRTTTI
ncbi:MULTISPECIES: hypothetical protein [Undibacterium]|jgi:hypothetical protein|uniref:Secreted protein n=1 Tax=Undibacterium aquatile TaxID=1537398 RepID=A0ABR6XHZ4_9BURK|nr:MULTISPECIES: hypothetical protein [Undibacterium]MBC3812383.1 hypothetical protein [Undibacterium aquatile]MBC3929290.1 hypothetical protein [Undibacterium sp. CY21W]MBK1890418.1 hypothetical protein [Undibacterium sp. 14-3-2]